MYNCPVCNKGNNFKGKGRYVKKKPNKTVTFKPKKPILKKEKAFAQAQAQQTKKSKAKKGRKTEGMGFVQVAEIKKLTPEEIENCIYDEPYNNIVRIAGVSEKQDLPPKNIPEACKLLENNQICRVFYKFILVSL